MHPGRPVPHLDEHYHILEVQSFVSRRHQVGHPARGRADVRGDILGQLVPGDQEQSQVVEVYILIPVVVGHPVDHLQFRLARGSRIAVARRQPEAHRKGAVPQVGESIPEHAALVLVDIGNLAENGGRHPRGTAVRGVLSRQRQQVVLRVAQRERDLDDPPHRAGRSRQHRDRNLVVVHLEVGRDRLLARGMIRIADRNHKANALILAGQIGLGIPGDRQRNPFVLGCRQLRVHPAHRGRPPRAAHFVRKTDIDIAVVVVGDLEVDSHRSRLFLCGRAHLGHRHPELHPFAAQRDLHLALVGVVGAQVQMTALRPFFGRLVRDQHSLLVARRHVEFGRRSPERRFRGHRQHAQGIDSIISHHQRPLARAADAHRPEVVVVGRRRQRHLGLLGHGLAHEPDFQPRILHVVGADHQILGENPLFRGEEGHSHPLAAARRQFERGNRNRIRLGHLHLPHLERVLGSRGVAHREGPLAPGVDLQAAEVVRPRVVDHHLGLFRRRRLHGEGNRARPPPQPLLILHAHRNRVLAHAQIGGLDLPDRLFEPAPPAAVGRLQGNPVPLARILVNEVLTGRDLIFGLGVIHRLAHAEELADRITPRAVLVLKTHVRHMPSHRQPLDGNPQFANLHVAVERPILGGQRRGAPLPGIRVDEVFGRDNRRGNAFLFTYHLDNRRFRASPDSILVQQARVHHVRTRTQPLRRYLVLQRNRVPAEISRNRRTLALARIRVHEILRRRNRRKFHLVFQRHLQLRRLRTTPHAVFVLKTHVRHV